MATSEAVRARPILFSGPMVRAILAGEKAQTRRIVKPQPDWIRPAVGDDGIAHGYCGSGPDEGVRCPYGSVGDELWVRETWCHQICDKTARLLMDHFWYAATDGDITAIEDDGGTRLRKDGSEASPWKPSIHMPRRASRITLRITSIRVERLQAITEEDARAEGVEPGMLTENVHRKICRACGQHRDSHAGSLRACVGDHYGTCFDGRSYRDGFAILWDQINGPGSWAANPWVWVVGFERVTPEPTP